MPGTDGAELLAGDGVAGHDGAVELERRDDGEHIVSETIGGVIVVGGNGRAGEAEAAPRDPVDVIGRARFCQGPQAESGACRCLLNRALPI